MKIPSLLVLAFISVAFMTFVSGFGLGYVAHPAAVLKNADVNMYSGGEVANIELRHCRVIADRTALDVNIHGCEIIDPPDGPAIAER